MSQTEQEQFIGQGTAGFVRTVTEAKLGFTVPDATMTAWISLSRTIRVADDLIDNEPNEETRNTIYNKAVGYLSGSYTKL